MVPISKSISVSWALAVCVGSLALACGPSTPDSHAPSPTPAPAVDTSAPAVEREDTLPPTSEVTTHAHPRAKIAFDLGAGWELSGRETQTLLASSPEGRAILMFHVAEAATVDPTLAAIDKALADEVSDAYFGPAKSTALAGMTAEIANGAGKLRSSQDGGGDPVELAKLVVATPSQNVLIVVAVVQLTASAAEKRAARSTLESLRPLE